MSVSATLLVIAGFAATHILVDLPQPLYEYNVHDHRQPIHLAFGDETEESMRRLYMWEEFGLCSTTSAQFSCEWTDPYNPDCRQRIERRLPCKIDRTAKSRYWSPDKALHAPVVQPPLSTEYCAFNLPVPRSMEDVRKRNNCIPWPYLYKQLDHPEWVPADQPTPYRGLDGHWMKLQL